MRIAPSPTASSRSAPSTRACVGSLNALLGPAVGVPPPAAGQPALGGPLGVAAHPWARRAAPAAGIYLSAACNGTRDVLADYEEAVVAMEAKLLRDPTLPLSDFRAPLQSVRASPAAREAMRRS